MRVAEYMLSHPERGQREEALLLVAVSTIRELIVERSFPRLYNVVLQPVQLHGGTRTAGS